MKMARGNLSEYLLPETYVRQFDFGDLILYFLLNVSFSKPLNCAVRGDSILHFDADLPGFFNVFSKRPNASEVLVE